MIGDLHVHTRMSDGGDSIAATIDKARARGLSYVGIVDHDSTGGLPLALDLGEQNGVTVVPGVEISAYDYSRNRKVHLLGYFMALPAHTIEAVCEPLRRARHGLTLQRIETLARAGYPVSEIQVRQVAVEGMNASELAVWPGVLFKQHIMEVLVRAGLADGIYGPVYRSLFKGNGICAGDMEYLDVFEALDAIHGDGGLAVLAHPGQLDSYDLVPELAAAGLDGIELCHGDHGPEDRRRVMTLAGAFDLVMTGGSDSHGVLGSDHEIGDICAPEDALPALQSALDRSRQAPLTET